MKFSVDTLLKKDMNPIKIPDAEANQKLSGDGKLDIDYYDSSTPSVCSDDITNRHMSKRFRTAITNWQKHQLEIYFTKQQYLTSEQVDTLSKELGLNDYVIKVWFQNRRAKLRKEGARKSSMARGSRLAPYNRFSLGRIPINHAVDGLMQLSSRPVYPATGIQRMFPHGVPGRYISPPCPCASCTNQCKDDESRHLNHEFRQLPPEKATLSNQCMLACCAKRATIDHGKSPTDQDLLLERSSTNLSPEKYRQGLCSPEYIATSSYQQYRCHATPTLNDSVQGTSRSSPCQGSARLGTGIFRRDDCPCCAGESKPNPQFSTCSLQDDHLKRPLVPFQRDSFTEGHCSCVNCRMGTSYVTY